MADKSSDWQPGPNVCRCCFAEGCYKDISTEYFWMGKKEVYSDMLLDTFDISIGYSKTQGPNSNSRLICEPCISRLRDATDFKRQVQECERTFMQHLDPGRSSTVEVPLEQHKGEIKLERVKIEEEKSDDDFDAPFDEPFGDDDDDDLDDQPLTKLATKIPKKESEDLLRNLLVKAEKRKAPLKVKVVPAKKVKKKDEPQPTASKAKPVEKKKKGITDLTQTINSSEFEVIKVKKNQNKGDLSETGSTICHSTPLKTKVNIVWRDPRDRKHISNEKQTSISDHPITIRNLERRMEKHNAAIIINNSNALPFGFKNGLYICRYCAESFPDFHLLRTHSEIHTKSFLKLKYEPNLVKIDITDLQCTLCSTSMTDVDSLKEHLVTQHQKHFKEENLLGVVPYRVTDNLSCVICGKDFVVFWSLNIHMNEHYSVAVCPECGKSFKSSSSIKFHMASHKEMTKFECKKCSMSFPSKELKNKHMSSVHPLRYKCNRCTQRFAEYRGRLNHLREEHNVVIEYPCDLCPAKFLLSKQRTQHVNRVHLKIRNVICDVCSAQFATRSQLNEHKVKHGGERIFKCEVCSKSYPRMKTLKQHMRIHNNDKRFKCEFCDYACVQKSCLTGHIKTHHPECV